MSDKERSSTTRPMKDELSVLGLTSDSMVIFAIASSKGPVGAGQPSTPRAADARLASDTFRETFGMTPETLRKSNLSATLPSIRLGPAYLGVIVIPFDKLEEIAGKGQATGLLYPSQDPAALRTIGNAQLKNRTSVVPADQIRDVACQPDAPQLEHQKQPIRLGPPRGVQVTTAYLKIGDRDLLAESLLAIRQAGGTLLPAGEKYLQANNKALVASVARSIGDRPATLKGPGIE